MAVSLPSLTGCYFSPSSPARVSLLCFPVRLFEMTGFPCLAFARGEACQASPLRGLSPVLFGWWDPSLDAAPLPSRCFYFFSFFFLRAGTRLWSSRVSSMVLCSRVPPERTGFFFFTPPPSLWSSRVSMSPFWVEGGPALLLPHVMCLPSALLFYWIPR